MNTAFKAVEALDEKDLKSKEVTALSDLLAALKRLCVEFWPSNADDCDRLRLTVICRMLKTPHFNCRLFFGGKYKFAKCAPIKSLSLQNERPQGSLQTHRRVQGRRQQRERGEVRV